jgi:hypothetical protein
MRILVITICGFLCVFPVTAEQMQQSSRPKSGTGSPAQVSSVANRQSSTAQPLGPANDQALDDLTYRVRKLELEVLEKSQEPKDRGPLFTALAAIFVGILALIGQFSLALREDRRSAAASQQALERARQEALFRQNETLLDFRLKQMELFYAPMRALLTQTGGLYDKMRLQLVQDEQERYRWAANTDPGRRSLEVRQQDGTWHDFRLLDQFPAVKRNPKALALADRVLAIGKEMTAIITRHAGLASGDLVDLLGQYMAHYAILSAIRQEDRTEPYPPGWHEMGYYPRELDARIAAGYREIAQIIADSAKESSRLLATISDANGSKRP